MKAFVVFPTICVFVLMLTLLKLNGQIRRRTSLLWTMMVTSIFGGIMTWFSFETFQFLYFANFVGILVCIPCITYLINRLFTRNVNKRIYWTRIIGLGLASTVLTIAVAGTLIFLSFLYNPMDPITNKEQTENR